MRDFSSVAAMLADHEHSRAALPVGTERVRLPQARFSPDQNDAAENVEAVLVHVLLDHLGHSSYVTSHDSPRSGAAVRRRLASHNGDGSVSDEHGNIRIEIDWWNCLRAGPRGRAMTPRCRPGDLAVVVRPTIPANLGRIVRVIRPYRSSPDVRMRGAGCIWLVEAAHPLTWNTNGRVHQEKQGPAPDEALQPIRGQATHQSQRLTRAA